MNNTDRIDEMKERMLLGFLEALRDIAFVKSTNSVTGEVQKVDADIVDMEAIIKINAEFDREELKSILVSRAG